MASYFKRNCRELTGWNRGKGIYWGGDRGSVPTDMTEMPKTRLDRALEDAQSVPIVLSCQDLLGRVPARPGTRGEASAHPAGRARGRQR
jgi:hypothetical protein